MENTDKKIIDNIKMLLNSMTPALQKVGLEVINNSQEVIRQSVNDFAYKTQTSLGTVVRFCKEIGFNSYAEFKLALAIEQSNTNNKETNENQVVNKIYEDVISSLNTTKKIFDKKLIKKVTTNITSKKHIYLYGVGASSSAIDYIYFKFTRLGIRCSVIRDVHYGLFNVSTAQENEMVIFVSSTGATIDVINMAKEFKKKGIYSVAISTSQRSELSKTCDDIILTGGFENPLTSGAVDVKINQIFITEVIFQSIQQHSSKYSDNFKKIAKTIIQTQN